MGMTFSCPGADSTLDKSFDALFMRSISFHGDDAKEATCSSSFNGRDSEPSILKALGSGKMIIKGSLSFKRRDSDPIQMETEFSIRTSDSENESSTEATSSQNLKTEIMVDDIPRSPVLESCSPKHEAAVKLQKVYKSFRTRRQLADCAVLAEQTWWKLLDFALLKRSSVSFFGIEKPESVLSRWSRASTKAAKVGKGLSKDAKARKLALQHWLEAIDPRHRYGHNLHFYYVCWLHCESQQPFFYWLDVGDGKEVNLEQHCPRWKLQQQCIKYLGPKEREAYEVIVENGKLVYKQSQQCVDTSEGPKDLKWIFVLSTSKSLYVGQKKKGSFQHSSFLAGGATSAAGRLVVENGILKAVWPHSGHYRPTEENFQELVSFLNEKNVDLTDVKRSPTDEDEESESRHTAGLRNSSSDNDLTKGTMTENTCAMFEDDVQQQQPASLGEKDISAEPSGTHSYEMSTGQSDCMSFAVSQSVGNLRAKNQTAFNRVYSQCVQDLFREFEGDSEEEADNKSEWMAETRTNEFEPTRELSSSTSATESQPDGWETAEKPVNSEQHYIYHKRNLFEEDQDVSGEPAIPREMILRRINSKKGMISYQLGKQLSFKWTTGAGPRIGCVRDFPSELQFHALEQVNLSPRGARTAKAFASPRYACPSPRSCAVTLKESSSGSSRNDLQVL